jgi:hypothetical protein
MTIGSREYCIAGKVIGLDKGRGSGNKTEEIQVIL